MPTMACVRLARASMYRQPRTLSAYCTRRRVHVRYTWRKRALDGSQDTLLSGEDVYEHFLALNLPDAQFRPQAKLLSLIPEICRQEVPATLRDNPLIVFEDPSVAFSTAAPCLDAYVNTIHSTARTKDVALEVVRKDQPGTRSFL